MATPREHFDRLAKIKPLLKADAATLEDLRSTRSQREAEFKKALQRLTDFMKSNKKSVMAGKPNSLKDQLARKDCDPKLTTAAKFAKQEIAAYDQFCSGPALTGLRRIKGNAKAFRKALDEVAEDTKKREKAKAPDVDTYRQLLMAWTKVEEDYSRHLDDAVDFPDKLGFDKGRAIKKLESDFSWEINEYCADDEF